MRNNIGAVACAWRKANGNQTKKSNISKCSTKDFKKDDVVKEIIRQSEVALKRIHKRNYLSVRQWIKGLIKERVLKIAKAIPDDGLSMGSYYKINVFSDAGKFIKTFLEINSKPLISVVDDRTNEYARSAKQKAKHYSHSVDLNFKDIFRMDMSQGDFMIGDKKLITEGRKNTYRIILQ